MENKQTAIEWMFEKLWDTPKDRFTWNAILEEAKQLVTNDNHLTDEEIDKMAIKYDEQSITDTPWFHFMEGAKWYREQLKQRQ